MTNRILSALLALIALTCSAVGQTTPTIETFANVNALQSYTFPGMPPTPPDIINLLGYYSPGDGGGGLLRKANTGDPDCLVPDTGQCFHDFPSANFYAREKLADNYGLVNVLYFGCQPEASDTPLSFDNSLCFTNAQTAAQAYGLAGINVCGNSVGSEWNITSGFTYTMNVSCPTRDPNRPETAGGSEPSSGDFRSYPYTLRVDGSMMNMITCGVVSTSMMATSGKMDGINILRARLNVSTLAPSSIQDLWNNRQAYTGTGLTIAGDGCQFGNGNILGFDTGILSNGPRELHLYNYKVDANNCRNFETQRGGGTIVSENGQCTNIVTELTTFSKFNLPISAITKDVPTGQLMVTLATGCGPPNSNCPLPGPSLMDGWVVQLAGIQSANGQKWTLVPTGSTSNWLLQNSTGDFIAGQSFSGVTFPNNSNILFVGVPSTKCPASATAMIAFCQIQPGQIVTDANGTACFPSGTQVAAVWYDYGRVALTNPTTCSQTGGETVTFTDTPFVLSLGSATVHSGGGGTGYAKGNVLTLSGGSCGATPPEVTVTDITTSGAIRTVKISQPGSCPVGSFPPTPNMPTGGSGTATLDIAQGENLSLSAGVREGIGTAIGNTIVLADTNSYTGGYRHCLNFADGSANSTVLAPMCFSDQTLQDNFQDGITFSGAAQSNTVVGGAVHYFGGNIVSSASADAALVANRVIGTTIGGNELNSGPNEILFVDEGAKPASSTPSNARLELEGVTSLTRGFAFVGDDVLGLGIKDSMLSSVQVFCQSAATAALIDRTGSTLQSNSCTAPANPSAAAGVVTPSPMSGTYATTNANCGQVIGSASATTTPLTVVLPASPVLNCRFWLIDDNTHGFLIDPDGSSIATALGSTYNPLPIAPSTNAFAVVSLAYNGTQWMADSGAPETLVANSLVNGQRAAHGQVRLTYVSATSLKLCPYNGPGGLIANGSLILVPAGCLFLPSTATTGASRLNYVYAGTSTVTVSGAVGVSGTGSMIRLTLSSISSLVNGDTITVMNVKGTTEANGTWVVTNVGAAGNTVDLVGSAFSNTFSSSTPAPTAEYAYLVARNSSHGPIQDANGVQVESDVVSRTLVGEVWLNASQQFSDSWASGSGCSLNVASYFNPLAKTSKAAFTADRTSTVTSLTEINSEIECDFLAMTTNGETRALNWSFVDSTSSNTVADGSMTAVGFDGSATEATVGYMGTAIGQKGNVSSAGFKSVVPGTGTDHHVASVYGAVIGSGSMATWLYTIAGSGTGTGTGTLTISIPQ